ncbi:MAG TPA: ubiquitin-like domain-containing protein [Candidatus Saccharimonadales bacterium]
MRNKFLKFKRKAAVKNRRRIRKFKLLSRHPFAVPVFTFLFLFVVSAVLVVVFVDRDQLQRDTRVVIVTDDGQKQIVPSVESTVGTLLKKMNVKIDPGDVVEPSLNTKIRQDDFRINIYRALPVKIVDGQNKTFTSSAATTPRSIARQTGAELYAEDRVITEPVRNFLRDGAIGEQVIIDRATPVNVNLYGTPEVIRTHAETVGDLVKEKGIKLSSSDQVLPTADTPITPNQQIFIAREGVKLQSVTERIAMPVETILDPGLAYGTTAVRQQGAPGERVVTYQINDNGTRSIIQNVVIREAVTQIVVRGASITGSKGDMARAGIAPSDFTYVDYIVQKESGWNYRARNASSGAYGLCQALPGSKMASVGSDWATNPVTQLKWCDGYAKGRYGSWAAAYNAWRSKGWW